MAKSPRRRGASQRYGAPEFRPYVTALGQLALAWNDLQESLGALFWTVMMERPPQPGDMIFRAPLWIWHSLRSDLAQREMLRAAVNHSNSDWGRSDFLKDINWLIKAATDLSHARNDAIHSPLFIVDRSLFGAAYAGSERVAPAAWLFNPRAVSLAKRENLLNEFHYCRDMAVTLSEYAREIDSALINQQRPWPGIPLLPSRKPQTGRRPQSRSPKSRAPRRRSSRV